jgi:Flp pilus assembly protein TadD
MEEYRRAIALAPRNALAHNNLGAALASQGRLAEAEAEFRRALELRPDLPEARANLERLARRGPRPAVRSGR